jgi:hypothetical protein
MKKKDKENNQDYMNNGSFIPSIISKLLFDGFQNWIRDYQHNRNIKKHDIVEEKLVIVENLQLKLDKRIKENKYKIDALKALLITSMIMNFLFFAVVLVFLILMF